CTCASLIACRIYVFFFFFFSSRRRHTRFSRDWSSDVCSSDLGNFNVLLTGGDAPYFVYHLKNKIFADPNLIFKGLYAISEHNNRSEERRVGKECRYRWSTYH